MDTTAGSDDLRDAVGTVQVTPLADVVRVTLTGDIDGQLDDELTAALATVIGLALPVMVDARQVTFMDSAGATFLARLYMRTPMTVAASRPVQFLLRVLAMDDVISATDPPPSTP